MRNCLYTLLLFISQLTACASDVFSESSLPEKDMGNKKHKKVKVALDRSLLDYSMKDTFGLPYPEGIQRIPIFEPSEAGDMKFNNHPQLVVFKDKLYATWVGHPIHEPSPESWVYYSYSEDGVNWVDPIRVGPDSRASGGWITDGKVLGCLLIVGDKINKTSNTEIVYTTDGINWSAPRVLLTNAAPSESARVLPSGRQIIVCHGLGKGDFEGVRKTRVMYTDSGDILTGWKEAELPDILPYNVNTKEKVARPVEASWYRRRDGILVMLFRDLWFEAKDRTWKLLYSVSYDDGTSWTIPVLTNIPDSDSMQCAGSFGRICYFVNNPTPTRRRVPLTIGISSDGEFFDKMFLIRSTPQPRRYEGISKTEGYSYPGSVVWGDYLYVAYATNKEDVEVSRIPLSSLR